MFSQLYHCIKKYGYDVFTEIIDLYWQIGKEVSKKAKNGGWGKSVVEEFSSHIAANFGNMRVFSPQNVWRMKQFYETYKDSKILSALSRELLWQKKVPCTKFFQKH